MDSFDLEQAIEAHDWKEMERILAEGISINEVGSVDFGPLTIFRDDREAIDRILAIPDLDVNRVSTLPLGATPLINAAHFGRPGFASLLKDPRVDVNAKSREDRVTVLIAAAMGSKNDFDADRIRAILAHPKFTEFNHVAVFGSALSQAVSAENVSAILEDSRIDPDRRRRGDSTPLGWHCYRGNLGIVEVLLGDERVDVNARGLDENTPFESLMIAKEVGNIKGTEDQYNRVVDLFRARGGAPENLRTNCTGVIFTRAA